MNAHSEEAIDEDWVTTAIGWTISDEAETELLGRLRVCKDGLESGVVNDELPVGMRGGLRQGVQREEYSTREGCDAILVQE